MVKQVVFVICFAAFLQRGVAQNDMSAPASLPTIVHAGDVYNPFIEKQSRLYNGTEHLGYSFKIKGHAYFLQRDLQTGTVVYDELEFINVLMLYDLLKDQLVIQHFNGFTWIGLVQEKVSAFTLNGHHFIRLIGDSLSRSPIITGYYDELYTGRLKVLVKRGKIIEETINDEVEREFIQHDLFFIQRDSTYYQIKSYKGLLTILKGRSKEVRQYLRKNRIKYRKDPESAILKATAYYDSLNK